MKFIGIGALFLGEKIFNVAYIFVKKSYINNILLVFLLAQNINTLI